MELKGKYLTVKINDGHARVFFDLPGVGSKGETQWTFMGRVEGETEGVGIWLTIEEVATPDGMIMPAPGPYTTLIRWDWIITAVATVDKPSTTDEPPPGQMP